MKKIEINMEEFRLLREEGKTYKEISKHFGCSVKTIYDSVRSHRRLLLSEMCQTLTADEMAKKLHLTRARIYQLMRQCNLSKNLPISFKKCAEELGVSQFFLKTRPEIRKFFRNLGGRRYIKRSNISLLKKFPAISNYLTLVCVACGRKFDRNINRPGMSKSCSDECKKARIKKKNKERRKDAKKNPGKHAKGWGKQVWNILRKWTPEAEKKWCAQKEALQISGASPTQLKYLSNCNILPTRPHPTKVANRNGKPVSLYPRNALLVVRRALLDKSLLKKAI